MSDLLSNKHKRLLDIADWAKYIGWLALGAHILYSAVLPLAAWGNLMQWAGVTGQNPPELRTVFIRHTAETVTLLANMAASALRGVGIYLVLKGTGLGLRMIVETNVNYQQARAEGETP